MTFVRLKFNQCFRFMNPVKCVGSESALPSRIMALFQYYPEEKRTNERKL